MINYKLLSVAFLIVASGCATRGFVHQQVDPVTCRVEVLETMSASQEQKAEALAARIAVLEAQVNEAQLATKAMLDEAAAKAVESALRAETAANAADLAAEKTEKLFELLQKK